MFSRLGDSWSWVVLRPESTSHGREAPRIKKDAKVLKTGFILIDMFGVSSNMHRWNEVVVWMQLTL